MVFKKTSFSYSFLHKAALRMCMHCNPLYTPKLSETEAETLGKSNFTSVVLQSCHSQRRNMDWHEGFLYILD